MNEKALEHCKSIDKELAALKRLFLVKGVTITPNTQKVLKMIKIRVDDLNAISHLVLSDDS